MVDEALAFVQFLHPGKEHAPDAPGYRSWNRGSHRRKFLRTTGSYLTDGGVRQGPVAFWGEWEPPSRIVAEFPASGDLPRFVHEPLLDRPASYAGLKNTDPYVFGERFLYTGCQQHTHQGRVETQLRRLTRGSVILFGSCIARSRFVIDTVFVVDDWFDHSVHDFREELDGTVDGLYWTVTLESWYAEGIGEPSTTFRLYRGATYRDPVDGMFSFAPCQPADAVDYRFARPEVRLPGNITPNLTQGKKITKLDGVEAVRDLWGRVVQQVEDQGLELGVRLDPPVSAPGGSGAIEVQRGGGSYPGGDGRC
jgi:hypothetical protein